jgi:hypothetical protein
MKRWFTKIKKGFIFNKNKWKLKDPLLPGTQIFRLSEKNVKKVILKKKFKIFLIDICKCYFCQKQEKAYTNQEF